MVSSKLQEIICSLRLLSAPANEQIQHLSDLFKQEVTDDWNIDELALEFEDAILTRKTLLERGELSSQELDCLLELDAFLERMSGSANAHLWTVEALRTRREWEEVREKANACLMLLELR